MKYTQKTCLALSFLLITMLWACNGQTRQHATRQHTTSSDMQPRMGASFDTLDRQFRELRDAFAADSMNMSPESRMTFHNMERMWNQMAGMQQGEPHHTGRGRRDRGRMRDHHQMMHDSGAMGRSRMGDHMSGMRARNMQEHMMSYAQGMQQMMRHSGNSRMANMYGQMATRMQEMMANQPQEGRSVPPSGAAGEVASGASLYTMHCGACHGNDGSGIRNAFPPLNGSSLVRGDKETLTKI